MRRLIGLLLLSATIAFAANELSGRPAPGFSLFDVDSVRHSLSDYRGKVVVLDMMKTDCPHCQVLSKILDAAEKHYGGAVKVLSVVHPPDTRDMVRAYIAKLQLSTTILYDRGPVAVEYLQLTPQNPSFATPHFFVIDQEGQIREDYGYSPLDREIFEGDGIYTILDRYVTPSTVAD